MRTDLLGYLLIKWTHAKPEQENTIEIITQRRVVMMVKLECKEDIYFFCRCFWCFVQIQIQKLSKVSPICRITLYSCKQNWTMTNSDIVCRLHVCAISLNFATSRIVSIIAELKNIAFTYGIGSVRVLLLQTNKSQRRMKK